MNFWGHFSDAISGWMASAWAAAVAGRLAWHTRLVQKGERQFFSKELILELPIVVMTYFIGIGIAAAIGYTGPSAGAVVCVAAYFGPGGLQWLAQKYVEAKIS